MREWGAAVGGWQRSPGRKPLMLEQHVRLVQQHQLKNGDEGSKRRDSCRLEATLGTDSVPQSCPYKCIK